LIGCPPQPRLLALHVSSARCRQPPSAVVISILMYAAAQVILTPVLIGISVGISHLRKTMVVGYCCAGTKGAC
jgi:hypothetical protein